MLITGRLGLALTNKWELVLCPKMGAKPVTFFHTKVAVARKCFVLHDV